VRRGIASVVEGLKARELRRSWGSAPGSGPSATPPATMASTAGSTASAASV